jgi:beta-N-acetylhexosaminidase
MSLGPVMIDLAGPELQPEDRELLRHPLVGGVLLFTRNYASPAQVQALVAEIHALREPRLLVAVDHEGGRVQRFRDGFTRLPPIARLGEIYDVDRKRARRLAETAGWLMAAELRALGIDLSFAPVLDVDHGVSAVIGDRAFHRRPEAVADLAHAYVNGMQRAGMAATGKHFPGHGGVQADSHHTLPVDERGYEDLRTHDLVPFERMIHYGLPALMIAHVLYPEIAPEPAGFSPFWLREVLRRRLGFHGAIFSDDLSMAGACGVGDCLARAHAALDAGCDMVLVCNDRAGAIQVLDGLTVHGDPSAAVRLARMHGRPVADLLPLPTHPEYQRAVEAVLRCDRDPLLDMDL